MNCTPTRPVSYTHLDVYKRQELGYALAVCVYPFLVLDLAKIVVSCIVGALLRKRLVQAGVLHLKEA